MESGVGLAPKEVRALSHALFPDAEPQCRTGPNPVPPHLKSNRGNTRLSEVIATHPLFNRPEFDKPPCRPTV